MFRLSYFFLFVNIFVYISNTFSFYKHIEHIFTLGTLSLAKIKTAGNHKDYLQSTNTICTTRTRYHECITPSLSVNLGAQKTVRISLGGADYFFGRYALDFSNTCNNERKERRIVPLASVRNRCKIR